jgi:hypothetical protein
MAEQAAVGTGFSAVRALRTSPIQVPPVPIQVAPVLLPPDVPYDTKTANADQEFLSFSEEEACPV